MVKCAETRATKGYRADAVRPDEFVKKFEHLRGIKPVLDYGQEEVYTIEKCRAAGISIFASLNRDQTQELRAQLLQAAMSHVGCPHGDIPKTFRSAIQKWDSTSAVSCTSFANWNGHRDVSKVMTEIEQRAIDDRVDYQLNAPTLLVCFVLKVIMRLGAETDKASQLMTTHKVWLKLPTAIVRWEQGRRQKYFHMVCPDYASRFESGSQMQHWEMVEDRREVMGIEDPDQIAEAEPSPQGSGQIASRHDDDDVIDVTERQLYQDVPDQMIAGSTDGHLMAMVLDSVLYPAPQTANEPDLYSFDETRTFTRADVEAGLSYTIAHLDDIRPDTEIALTEINQVINENSVQVLSPDKRYQIMKWMAAQTPLQVDTIKLLKDNLEVDQDTLTISSGGKVTLRVANDYPIRQGTDRLLEYAAFAEPPALAQDLISLANQFRVAETVYKNTIRDLAVATPAHQTPLGQIRRATDILDTFGEMSAALKALADTEPAWAAACTDMLHRIALLFGGSSFLLAVKERAAWQTDDDIETAHLTKAAIEHVGVDIRGAGSETVRGIRGDEA